MTTAQDAISALAAHVGIPLGMRDGSCELLVGGQPFSIRHDEARDRLVVSALVADDLPSAPSRTLVCDLLNLGFGMMEDGLPAVARDPETGFLAAFAIFPLATLSPAEFPDAFDKFVSFATALADRLDAERAGMSVSPEGEPPADGESPAFDKFVSFATALAGRLDAERAGMSVPPEGEPPVGGETPAFDPGLISV